LRRALNLIGPVSLWWRASLLRPPVLWRHLLTLLFLPPQPLILIRPLCCGPLLFRHSGARLGTRHVLLGLLALRLVVPIPLIPCVRGTRHALPLLARGLIRPNWIVAVVPWFGGTRNCLTVLT
jgi:hypothetical protein